MGYVDNVADVGGLVRGFLFAFEITWSFVAEPPYKAKSIRNSIIKKIKCQLGSWKMMYLS